MMDRREFFRRAALAFGFAAFFPRALNARELGVYPTAQEAFEKLGVGADGEFFAAVGDPHFLYKNPQNAKLFAQIAEELNAMPRKPAFCALMGDLLSTGSSCFADIRKNHTEALDEMAQLKDGLKKLSPIPAKLVLGNHDTVAPDDFDNVLYRENMPELKTYYCFDFAGVHFAILNGGHCAFFTPEQRDWLKADIAALPKGSNVVILIHQPMGSVAGEYAASADVRAVFDNFDGDVKIICGHIHVNRQTALRAPSGKIVPQFAVEAPRNEKAPVYWLFAIKNGALAGGVFRDKHKKFTAFDFDGYTPEDWELPFEKLGVKQWANAASPEFTEIERKGWFNGAKCVYYYFYLHTLSAKVDFSKAGKYSRVAILAHNFKGKRDKAEFLVSADGENYISPKPEKSLRKDTLVFGLPENMQGAPHLYFKLVCGSTNSIFGGIAAL